MNEFNEWYTEKDKYNILESIYINSDGCRDLEDDRREYTLEEKLCRRIDNSIYIKRKRRDMFLIPKVYRAGDINFLVDILDESYVDNEYPMLVVKHLFKNWGNNPLLIVLFCKNINTRLIVTANDKAVKYISCLNIGNYLGKKLDIKMKGNIKMCQGGKK